MLDASEVIRAIQTALARSGGMNVVYIHETDSSPPFSAIVRFGTPEWDLLHSKEDGTAENMIPHNHIEPGMF